MYNARLFYNNTDGTVLRYQTILDGEPLPLEDELNIVLETSLISANEISYFEWCDPENELEAIISEGKLVKVDVSQTPNVLYGVEREVSTYVNYADIEDYEAALAELGV